MKNDFKFADFAFKDTTIKLLCLSERGSDRMNGAFSVNIRKSAGPELAARLEQEGYAVDTATLV